MFNQETKGKLYAYFTKRLGLRPYTRGWLKGDCPDCSRIDKFGVNISMNRTNCFVCGYHPIPIDLVIELEGLEVRAEAMKFLKIYEGAEYLEPVVKRIERVDLSFPEGFKNLRLGDSFLAKQARKYVEGRGFDPIEKAYQGWGYGTKGDYLGYIIIPFYMGGTLIYYNARKFMGTGPKYINPTIEEFGIGKSLLLYNIDALAIYSHIYMVEGVFNADTLGDNAIATGGKKISKYQISMMIKSKAIKYTLLLDPDAMEDSVKLAMSLSYHKKVRVVALPDDNDVNDLGKKKTLKIVRKVGWMNYHELLKLKDEQRPKYPRN